MTWNDLQCDHPPIQPLVKIPFKSLSRCQKPHILLTLHNTNFFLYMFRIKFLFSLKGMLYSFSLAYLNWLLHDCLCLVATRRLHHTSYAETPTETWPVITGTGLACCWSGSSHSTETLGKEDGPHTREHDQGVQDFITFFRTVYNILLISLLLELSV